MIKMEHGEAADKGHRQKLVDVISIMQTSYDSPKVHMQQRTVEMMQIQVQFIDNVVTVIAERMEEMELTDADELNLATTSDIYFQNTPWTTRLPSPTIPTSTTMSLRNSLQLWSIEQGNLLR